MVPRGSCDWSLVHLFMHFGLSNLPSLEANLNKLSPKQKFEVYAYGINILQQQMEYILIVNNSDLHVPNNQI